MAFLKPSSNISPAPAAPPTDKWRLASQMQKAVRHGRVDAARWAVEQLAEVDPNYLRYRLSVIAVEDVGASQQDRVLDAFSGGWGKKAVEQKGGTDFLVDLVEDFARGVKDRLPCDWMACTRWLMEFEQSVGPWATLSPSKATELAFDRDQPWWIRGLSGWRLAGTKRFSNPFLPDVEGDWDGWKAACADFASDPQVSQIMAVGQHQREGHPVFLGLAIAERKFSQSKVTNDRLPNLPDIGPWLSATFDKHTSDGKRAYGLWLSSHHEARQWLAGRGLDSQGQLDAVGRLAFWLEGGQCDQHWTHPLAQAVLADTKRIYLMTRNMNAQIFARLCVDPGGWHEARRRVVGGPASTITRQHSFKG